MTRPPIVDGLSSRVEEDEEDDGERERRSEEVGIAVEVIGEVFALTGEGVGGVSILIGLSGVAGG